MKRFDPKPQKVRVKGESIQLDCGLQELIDCLQSYLTIYQDRGYFNIRVEEDGYYDYSDYIIVYDRYEIEKEIAKRKKEYDKKKEQADKRRLATEKREKMKSVKLKEERRQLYKELREEFKNEE